jgi:hypothetical protein
MSGIRKGKPVRNPCVSEKTTLEKEKEKEGRWWGEKGKGRGEGCMVWLASPPVVVAGAHGAPPNPPLSRASIAPVGLP